MEGAGNDAVEKVADTAKSVNNVKRRFVRRDKHNDYRYDDTQRGKDIGYLSHERIFNDV